MILKHLQQYVCGLTGHSHWNFFFEELSDDQREKYAEQYPGFEDAIANAEGFKVCQNCDSHEFYGEFKHDAIDWDAGQGGD